jgi:acetylxylan esterase
LKERAERNRDRDIENRREKKSKKMSSSTTLTMAKRLTASLALMAGAATSVAGQATGAGECTEVHIFLSRGNNEPYPGRQGVLVNAICDGLPSCDYEDIAFDNALETEFCGAVESGRVAGIRQITAYNERCPDTQLVVSGYSQGAQVVGDLLGGGGGIFFEDCFQQASGGLSPSSAPGNMSEFSHGP